MLASIRARIPSLPTTGTQVLDGYGANTSISILTASSFFTARWQQLGLLLLRSYHKLLAAFSGVCFPHSPLFWAPGGVGAWLGLAPAVFDGRRGVWPPSSLSR